MNVCLHPAQLSVVYLSYNQGSQQQQRSKGAVCCCEECRAYCKPISKSYLQHAVLCSHQCVIYTTQLQQQMQILLLLLLHRLAMTPLLSHSKWGHLHPLTSIGLLRDVLC